MVRTLVPPPTVQLSTAVDERCDGCGAAARIQVTLAASGNLTFCGHHANRYARPLLGLATLVVVESGFDWLGLALLDR